MNIPSMQELLEAGVHFGHRVSRGNPKMRPFIYGVRDGVHIIDLAKSEAKLKEAVKFVYDLGVRGGTLLVVGTKKQSRDIAQDLAKQAGAYYLNEKWLGGMLTNFDEIRKNIKKLNDLQAEKDRGELTRYTKKEQLLIDRKLQKFQKCLGGVSSMEKIPDVVFVMDTSSDVTAVKEANKVGVTTIGVSDTNSDPGLLDYPIPANDDGIRAIQLIAQTVVLAYSKGRQGVDSPHVEPQVSKEGAEKRAVKARGQKKEKQTGEKVPAEIKDEVKVLEEEVEKQVLEESERKTV